MCNETRASGGNKNGEDGLARCSQRRSTERFLTKTSKFDWTPNDIRIEKISRFLEQHGTHFEFDSRTFNYSMPKEGSSGVIGENNST